MSNTSETFHPTNEIPTVEAGGILDTMVEFAKPDGPPAFIIRHSGSMPPKWMIPSIGAEVLATGHTYLGWSNSVRYWEEGISENTQTPEHLDGAQAGRFVQMNTLLDGPDAKFVLRRRILNPQLQADLRNFLASKERIYDFDEQAFLSDMPESVRNAPLVDERQVTATRNTTIVFWNGFPGAEVSEGDVVLTTHEVSSVDERGEPVDRPRQANVGYISTRKTIIPPAQTPAPSEGRKRISLRRSRTAR